ncbi:MAG: hypothetical protein GF313_02715 [Caldithrix sp.]|nr:hypothetical protein [Caldithrix sp.]
MSLWETIKKGLVDGLHSASDLTSEYTHQGKIRIAIISVKKEIEEKFIELGGRVYHSIEEDNQKNVTTDKNIQQLIEQLKELEEELYELQNKLNGHDVKDQDNTNQE